MKSVLISIQPKYCELIANGKKTTEVRKTVPKLETPFKCYIYCTKKEELHYVWHKGEHVFCDDENSPIFDKHVFCKDKPYGLWNLKYGSLGKIIGEFVCDKIYNLVQFGGGIAFADENLNQLEPQLFRDMSCLTDKQTEDYLGNRDGYAWHISQLKIYDKPKELGEFKKLGYMSEEDWLFALYPNTHCHYQAWAKRFEITRPPQSWQYVEEVSEARKIAAEEFDEHYFNLQIDRARLETLNDIKAIICCATEQEREDGCQYIGSNNFEDMWNELDEYEEKLEVKE